MFRSGVIVLCCSLSACEKEGVVPARQPAARHSARTFSPADDDTARKNALKSRDATHEARMRAEKRAAKNDPELQRLLKVEVSGVDPFGGRAGPDDEAIAAIYGGRYPLAGLHWLVGLGSKARTQWLHFAEAYYQADPQGAFETMSRLSPHERFLFAEGLCQAASARDRELLWKITSKDPSSFDRSVSTLHARLLSNQARSDPEGAWQLARERMPSWYNENQCLGSLHNLDSITPYPIALLDRVAPGEMKELIHQGLHACRSRENVEPIAQWLAANPPLTAAQLDILYADISGWEGVYGNAAKAREWALKIADSERRDRAIRDLPEGSEQ